MEDKWFTLTIVRHGETEANKTRIIQGQTDCKLNETGVQQAQKLSEYFKRNNQTFDYVFSSDLSRASVTCRVLVGPSQTIITDKRLRERYFNHLEGQNVQVYFEEAEKAGFTGKRLRHYVPKGGETDEDIEKRLTDFFTNFLLKTITPNSNVLIVTHGGVVIEFMRLISESFQCDFNGQHAFRVPQNTAFSVFKIQYTESKILKTVCERLHISDHLKEKVEDNMVLAV